MCRGRGEGYATASLAGPLLVRVALSQLNGHLTPDLPSCNLYKSRSRGEFRYPFWPDPMEASPPCFESTGAHAQGILQADAPASGITSQETGLKPPAKRRPLFSVA